MVPETSSESESISSRQGLIIEEVDEDMDDAERDPNDTDDGNEETKSEGIEELEKGKSGSSVWDKVVTQSHPDHVQEQQDHDAWSQSGS
mgnify:CR=1 FL=1